MSNPKDYCGQASISESKKIKKTSWIDKAKNVVNKILNATKNSGSSGYSNAGYNASNTNYNSVNNNRIAYDLNMLSDKETDPFYIYYRDDTEYMWKKNYSYNNSYIRTNIELIHYNIVIPLRYKINEVFGENVSVNIEYCYLCENSLTKKRLKSDHLFGEARAVLLNITGERATTIYHFIMNWTSDDKPYDSALNEDEEVKPINYGLMKLCDVYEKDEFQRLYITLPFTEAELKLDELLIHNKSNFYYTPTNDLLMAPEANTSTKIFPKYVEDNNVEDGFNKLDDIDDEIEKLEKEINDAKEDQDSATLDQLNNELDKLEQDKEYIQNPNNSLSDVDLNLKKAQDLYDKNPNEDNKNALNEAKEELEKYPTLNDSLPDYIIKLNGLEVIIADELLLEDTNKYINYWKARKLVALKLAIMNRENETFTISEEELNNAHQNELATYNSIRKERYDEIYNNKLNALYPDGNIPEDTVIPYIEVTDDEINMDDIAEPNKDSIKAKLEEEFNNELVELKDIYTKMDIERIDAITKEYPLNKITITDLEFNNIEKVEYNKFNDLTELVKECDRYVAMNSARDVYKQFIDIDVYINANEPKFNIFLDNKSDFNDVRDYYFSKLYEQHKDETNIDNKIDLSKKLSTIINNKNFNSTFIPNMDTKEYADYALQYIDCELELHKDNKDKVKELNTFKDNVNTLIANKEYNKINLDTIKTEIFNFGDLEYSGSKAKYLLDSYKDNTKTNDERILTYIAYKILEDKGYINGKAYYKDLNNTIGMPSFDLQVISNILDPYYKDTANALDNIDTEGITNISNDLKNKIELFDTYLFQKVNVLNTYLTKYNDYMLYILYNNDMNVNINKAYKSNVRNHNFIDYGCEYVTLSEKIGEHLLDTTDSDNLYKIRLKSDRLMMKRQLVYARLNETDKKISNYNMEIGACIDFNKLNRFKEIKNELLPQLTKQKELEDNFIPEDTATDLFTKRKQLEKERLEYLYKLDVTNIPMLYRYVTNDITMDYEYNKGVFEYLNLNKDDKYVFYLNKVIEAIKAHNNSALNNEISALEKEIAYIQNRNNEKKNKLLELRQELSRKKAEISAELKKRKDNKEYLHEKTRSLEIENKLKLKYKNYIKIESLPSTGVTYKFPFLLYSEFKDIYTNTLSLKTPISVYEYLDAYNQYSKIHYNLFNARRVGYINDFHNKWINVNYNPNTTTMTDNINSFVILLDNDIADINVHKNIADLLPIINGFMDMDSILLTDNEVDYDSGVLVKYRRTLDGFKSDLIYLLENIYSTHWKTIQLLNVKAM